MLLAVAKSDSYARNENSYYFLAMYPTGSDDMIDQGSELHANLLCLPQVKYSERKMSLLMS